MKRTIANTVLSRPKLAAMVHEMNTNMDGPAGVALRFTSAGPPVLVCVDDEADAVIHLPGDGKRYPEKSFVSALFVSEVLE